MSLSTDTNSSQSRKRLEKKTKKSREKAEEKQTKSREKAEEKQTKSRELTKSAGAFIYVYPAMSKICQSLPTC